MASLPPLGRLFSEVTCSICLDFFQEPVALECDHNFCRLCISRSWEKGDAFYSCPECREVFKEKRLKPNRMLANIVEGVRELKLEPRQGQSAFYCQRHEERHKLFCLECQGVICVVCSCSSEHQGHVIIPIEEAYILYKDRLEKSTDFLQIQKEQACHSQSQQEAKIYKIKEKGRLLKERVEVDLSSVYRFLDLRKWELEAKIDEEVCRTVQPLQEDLAKICLEACTIEQTIRDVQLQLSYGEPQEMLQDIKQLLDRCKQEYIAPTDFPTDLHTDSIITPFRYVRIWDELKALVPARESVKLDARTAHPRLLLSEDLRSVVDGEKRRECSLSPQLQPLAVRAGRQRLQVGATLLGRGAGGQPGLLAGGGQRVGRPADHRAAGAAGRLLGTGDDQRQPGQPGRAGAPEPPPPTQAANHPRVPGLRGGAPVVLRCRQPVSPLHPAPQVHPHTLPSLQPPQQEGRQ